MLVLLDRDGVLNLDRPESVRSPDQYEPIPGAAEAVARLNQTGHKVALVTNQAVVGRGDIDKAMLESIHVKMAEVLATAGAHLDDVHVCTDPPGSATGRRKPGPGMLREAMADLDFAADDTIMIGDALPDLQAASAANVKSILIRTGKGKETEANGYGAAAPPVAIVDELKDAVDFVLSEGS